MNFRRQSLEQRQNLHAASWRFRQGLALQAPAQTPPEDEVRDDTTLSLVCESGSEEEVDEDEVDSLRTHTSDLSLVLEDNSYVYSPSGVPLPSLFSSVEGQTDLDSVSVVIPPLHLGRVIRATQQVHVRIDGSFYKPPKSVDNPLVGPEAYGLTDETCLETPLSPETFSFPLGEIQLQSRASMTLYLLRIDPSSIQEDPKKMFNECVEAVCETWELAQWEGRIDDLVEIDQVGEEDPEQHELASEQQTLPTLPPPPTRRRLLTEQSGDGNGATGGEDTRVEVDCRNYHLKRGSYRLHNQQTIALEMRAAVAFLRSFLKQLRRKVQGLGPHQCQLHLVGTNWKTITFSPLTIVESEEDLLRNLGNNFQSSLAHLEASYLNWKQILTLASHVRLDPCVELTPKEAVHLYLDKEIVNDEESFFYQSIPFRRWGLTNLAGGFQRKARPLIPPETLDGQPAFEGFEQWTLNDPHWARLNGVNVYETLVRNMIIQPGTGGLRHDLRLDVDCRLGVQSLEACRTRLLSKLLSNLCPLQAEHNSLRVEVILLLKSGSLITPDVRPESFVRDAAGILASSCYEAYQALDVVEIPHQELHGYISSIYHDVSKALAAAIERVRNNPHEWKRGLTVFFSLVQGTMAIVSSLAYGVSRAALSTLLEKHLRESSILRPCPEGDPFPSDDSDESTGSFFEKVVREQLNRGEGSRTATQRWTRLEQILGFHAFWTLRYVELLPQEISSNTLGRCCDVLLACLFREAIFKRDGRNNHECMARDEDFDNIFLNMPSRTNAIQNRLIQIDGWTLEDTLPANEVAARLLSRPVNWVFCNVLDIVRKRGMERMAYSFTERDLLTALQSRLGSVSLNPSPAIRTRTSLWVRKGSLCRVTPTEAPANPGGRNVQQTHPNMSLEPLEDMPITVRRGHRRGQLPLGPHEVAYWLMARAAWTQRSPFPSVNQMQMARGWGFEFRAPGVYRDITKNWDAFRERQKAKLPLRPKNMWDNIFTSPIFKADVSRYQTNGFRPVDAEANRSLFQNVIQSLTEPGAQPTAIPPLYMDHPPQM